MESFLLFYYFEIIIVSRVIVELTVREIDNIGSVRGGCGAGSGTRLVDARSSAATQQ
jgi:hypothetical protein